MTKVKQSKSRKAGTTASVSVKDQKALEGRSMIIAEKNGNTRSFSKNIWDHLPEDKEGWKEVQGKPADIDTSNSNQNDDPKKDEAFNNAVEAYKTAFGTSPVDTLTTEDLLKAVSDKETHDATMIDHVITQEDLDLDPELAKSGAKVGETIKVEKPKGGTE